MLTFSYRVYMGFVGYLCAYTPKKERREKGKNTKSKRRRTPTEGKRKKEQKKEA